MLTLRKLRIEDTEHLSRWGLHSDSRFSHYDFRYFTKEDFRYWYRTKQQPPFRWIYAIVDRGEVVGFVTMKQIQWFLRRAEFGLVIDPARLSQGYGTEGLKKFMHHYFETLHMRELKLRVSDFNSRARKVYERLGFQLIRTELYPFEDQTRNFELILNTQDFVMKGPQLMTKTHSMTLKRRDYELLCLEGKK